jgi:molybdate transport system substrate-binding protein
MTGLSRSAVALAAGALLVAGLAGCGEHAAAGSAGSTARPSSPVPLSGAITVAAAASLHRVLPKLAAGFERAHPGTSIRFTFGGSSALAAQIVAGGPVDVFAAASAATMRTVTDARLTVSAPVVVARNRLEIAVPKGNPGHVRGLADFAAAAETVVVCAPKVPCGAAAEKVFALAKVHAKPDSYETDVTGVLTRVQLGDADAGLVYRTDVRAAGGDVQGIDFPESAKAITDYPIAVLGASRNRALAEAFVDQVVLHGGATFEAAGFLAAG